ncbi:MAG TPA: methionyl-tRNA formyltransferase, partial [Oceanospirillaceae bacterium]|nr:methionyl-tRNA formyltransferase [Oceanospirillaceae bacterium]
MSNQPLRIIFAGTPEFAARHLQALVDSKHQILAVYSQPDRPAGRGRKLTASPVKQLAVANNIDVQQPLSLKDPEEQAHLAAYKAD